MKGSSKVFVGLDVGTHSVKVSVMTRDDSTGRLRIVGKGNERSQGVVKGEVTTLMKVADAIATAIERAEMVAGLDSPIKRVMVGVPSVHIYSQNLEGLVAVQNNEVTPVDVKRVVETALQRMPVAKTMEIIHKIPQRFSVDDLPDVREPIGMAASKLQVFLHVVAVPRTSITNLQKSVSSAGYSVDAFYLSSLAGADVVLSQDEKELGVVYVDMGSAITDIVVFYEGGIYRTASVNIGADKIIMDISKKFAVSTKDAQALLEEKAVAHPQLLTPSEDETIPIRKPGMSYKTMIKKSELASVVRASLSTLFEKVRQEVMRSGFLEELRSGAVLTGGLARLAGIEQVFSEAVGLDARVGTVAQSPLYDEIEDVVEIASLPEMTASIGLAYHHYKFLTGGDELGGEGVPGSRFLKGFSSFLRKIFLMD